jgi:Tropinone reductase 1
MAMTSTWLTGRRVAVTGGLGALGRRTGLHLAACGASVALIDRAAPVAVDGIALVLGGVDLGEAGAAGAAMDEAAARLGGLDGLVNVAGGFAWQTVAGGDVETWDRMYAINLRTALLASQAALPHLRRAAGAAIVNVGSVSGITHVRTGAAYGMSKAALHQMTRNLAVEWAEDGVRVNCVAPWYIRTWRTSGKLSDPDYLDEVLLRTPLARIGEPEEVAEVAAFLASDAASQVNGQTVRVNGGRSFGGG